MSDDVVSAEKAQQVIDAVNAACELGDMSSTEEAAALARLRHTEEWSRVCGAHPEAMWIAAQPWATYAESERARQAHFRSEARKKAAAAMSQTERARAMFAAFPWSNMTFRVGRAVVSTSMPSDPALLTAEIITENARSLAMVAGVDAVAMERWVMTGDMPEVRS